MKRYISKFIVEIYCHCQEHIALRLWQLVYLVRKANKKIVQVKKRKRKTSDISKWKILSFIVSLKVKQINKYDFDEHFDKKKRKILCQLIRYIQFQEIFVR